MLPFLSSSVPNLGLNDFFIDPNASGGKFDTDCRFRFKAKLVSSKSRQQIRFPDAGISDQHHLKQVIVVVIRSIRCHVGLPGRILLPDFLKLKFGILIMKKFYKIAEIGGIREIIYF